MRAASKRRFKMQVSREVLSVGILLAVALISGAILLLPLPTSPAAIPLSLGEVASIDILAPRAISYQSEVLTEIKQQEAADEVLPQYAPPDAKIARNQVTLLRASLNFINSVRADTYATPEQKSADLAALQHIHLTPENVTKLLELSDTAWQTVQQESISMLEQVMRSTIREDRLEDARRGIPALVSLSLTEDQASLVAELISAFVAPNSLYSEDLTVAKREAARQAVEPVIQNFVAEETVVPRGHVITAVDLEALDQLGLLQPEVSWKDQLSVIALVAVNFAFIALYFVQRPDLRSSNLSMLLMAVLFLLFLYGARLLIPNRTVIPYLFPLAGFSMLVAALVSSRAAIILSLPLSILAGYGIANSMGLTMFYLFTCSFGVLMLRNMHRILTFFWAGFGIGVSGAAMVAAYHIANPAMDLVGMVSLIGASMFNGLASASIAIVGQYLLSQLLGMTTTLQLLEVSRPDHPLLQEILRHAPGTYQHSLQIANLAEQAAESIGADTLLTRVGALYHDAGKTRFPQYFIENQVPGSRNPHDALSPAESAAIIIQHVVDGVELANKYRLPKQIQNFILEHHGTMITRYQYHQAIQAVGGDAQQVDMEAFRYPGPRPQSRETALVMLADGVEARARADRPDTEEAIRAMVKDTVDKRLASNQLDDTPLTLANLSQVIDSFTVTLRGVYHPRIQYPSSDETTLRSIK